MIVNRTFIFTLILVTSCVFVVQASGQDTRIINGTPKADQIVISDAGNGMTTVTVNGTPNTFTNPEVSLTINTLDLPDTIVISSLADPFPGSLIIDAGLGEDTIIIDSSLRLSDSNPQTDEKFQIFSGDTINLDNLIEILAREEIYLDGATNINTETAIMTSDSVHFTDSVDGNALSFLEVSGDVTFNGPIGGTRPFGILQLFKSVTMQESVGLVRTSFSQNYIQSVNVNGDIEFLIADETGTLKSGDIQINAISANNHDVRIETLGGVRFSGTTNTFQNLYVNAEFLDLGSLNRALSLQFNSSDDVVFDAPVFLSINNMVHIEQHGTGAIDFRERIIRGQSGSDSLTVMNHGGDIIFNDTVRLGELLVTNDGALSDLIINTNQLRTSASEAMGISSEGSGLLRIDTPIRLVRDTTLAERFSGMLDLNGDITAGKFEITFETSDISSTLDGVLTGNNGFNKTGTGTLTITSIGNFINGHSTIVAGTLVVDGDLVSDVRRSEAGGAVRGSSDQLDIVGGTLSGNGVVDTLVEVVNGDINPGDGYGVLSSGFVFFQPEGDGAITIELGGLTPGIEHDQLIITRGLTINDADLDVVGPYIPAGMGNQFLIVDNQSASSITGTFKNLPEDAYLNANGPLQISYVGGDGNDIVLIDNEGIFADDFEALIMIE